MVSVRLPTFKSRQLLQFSSFSNSLNFASINIYIFVFTGTIIYIDETQTSPSLLFYLLSFISSLSHSTQPALSFHGSNFLSPDTKYSRVMLSLPPKRLVPSSMDSHLRKPLHVESFSIGKKKKDLSASFCRAYEAEPIIETEAAKKVKIGIYFVAWWGLNIIFNIYNKKVLNVYAFPWLTSTLSLAAGSVIMLLSWALGIAQAPKTDFDFWKSLFPVAAAHTIGHVAATVSMSTVAVSFAHIIKSSEPAFSVLISRFLLGESFPSGVYLSLIPIIGGCSLAALTELNFNMTGFMGAIISNLAFVFRNIFSKKGMKGKSVSGMNYYACLSMLSLLILTPFAIIVEGPHMWAAGFREAMSQIGPQIIWWLAAQSITGLIHVAG